MSELETINRDIEDDSDTQKERYEKDTFIYDPEKIKIDSRQPTIEQLLRRIDEDALDLAPDFQRQPNLWEVGAKSRLIESIIIRIPLPAFYIDGTNEDKWLVVDGLQRLFALKQFIKDKTKDRLKLSGLEYLTELEGKNYDELDRRYQRRIEETQVQVYLIEKGTPPEVKYNIFKRINTGGLPLKPQELRHALNPGNVTKFLAKLAESEEFKRVTNLGDTRKKRMDDREFVIGFLAFTLTRYQEYKNRKRDLFLHEAMSKINRISDEDKNLLEEKFIKAMNETYNIFGTEAFRKPSKNGKRNPVNQALFETWSVSLSNISQQEINLLKLRKSILMSIYERYIEKDSEFLKSISQASEKIEYRFRTVENIIKETLS